MSTLNPRRRYHTQAGGDQQSPSKKASADPKRNQERREDSDDDIEPPTLSDLGRSVLEQKEDSPESKATSRSSVLRTPTQASGTNLALSLRIKRMGLMGAPVRRAKPSPESGNETSPHEVKSSSQYQEPFEAVTSTSEPVPKSLPLPQASTERRILQSPPDMSLSKPMTTSAGASSRTKKRRAHFIVNGKVYPQLGDKIGSGGSSEVYCVKGDHADIFALKRVKLAGLDENIFMGYKGEIDLLTKLKDEKRVIRLYDYQLNEPKQMLYMVCGIFSKSKRQL